MGNSSKTCDEKGINAHCLLTIKEAVIEANKPLTDKVEAFHNRMFIDNGRKSFQTNQNSLMVKVNIQWGLLIVIFMSVIGMWFKVFLEQ